MRETPREAAFEEELKKQKQPKKEEAPKREAETREMAPLPMRLQEVLVELGELEEAERKILKDAREISEVLQSFTLESPQEQRIAEKLGKEMALLQDLLEDNQNRIAALKKEQEDILNVWEVRQKALELSAELEIPKTAAVFFGVGESKELLERYEALKEVRDASPEEINKEIVGAAKELEEEGLKIDTSEFEVFAESERKALLSEATALEALSLKTEGEAKHLEKQIAEEEKQITHQLDAWRKKGIDVEAEERGWPASVKLALRRLFNKKFSAEYTVYAINRERTNQLRDELILMQMGAAGRRAEAARLREVMALGLTREAVKSLSMGMIRKAIRTVSATSAPVSRGKPVMSLR